MKELFYVNLVGEFSVLGRDLDGSGQLNLIRSGKPGIFMKL